MGGQYTRGKIIEGKVRELKQKREKQSGGNNIICDDMRALEFEIKILNSMSTYEEYVRDEENYTSCTFYPTDLQLYNKGKLTLVSKQFMQWAKTLVQSINQHISIEEIWRKKNTIMLEAKRIIKGDKRLYGSFKKAFFSQPVKYDKVVSTCHAKVVIKTTNARAGKILATFQDLFVGHYSKKILISGKHYRCNKKANTRKK